MTAGSVEAMAQRPLTAGRPRVAIVFGGASAEHGISCLTAASVARVVDTEAYDVVGLGITRDGRWVVMPGDQVAALTVRDRQMPEVGPADGPTDDGGRQLATTSAAQALSALPDLSGVDVAFSLLHGPFGEDGTIQGMFEMLGIRYVGSGVFASAAGMDKHYMKVLMDTAEVPVGPYLAVTDREWADDPEQVVHRVAEHLRFPVFVKPARAGSSFGINKVGSARDVAQAVEFARRYDPKVIVEQGFVAARELECGVLDDGSGARASVVAEIRTSTESGFYDFDAKYLPGEDVSADVPADVPDDVSDRVRALSVRVFEALGCEGLARVDFFLDEDGSVYCNEINTMPGFTETSMYPRMWAETGVDYPTLVDRLIKQGLHRRLGLR